MYSGKDGTRLNMFTGASVVDGYGLSIAGVGDVDGDSFPDLVIGARNDDTLAPNGGRVEG